MSNTKEKRELPWLWLAGIAFALLCGIFLRVFSFEQLHGVGFDENIYSSYAAYLDINGLGSYPKLVSDYAEKLKTSPIVFLPPTRLTFILASTVWMKVTNWPPVESVRFVSCLAAIGTLGIATGLAWRLGGPRMALGVAALMAVAPTQVSMAHRALIDGFFGMFALLAIWSLWELLQNPRSRAWLTSYTATLAILVLTKENFAFLYIAILGLLAVNRWLRFGEIRWPILAATAAGPALGLTILAVCAGGFPVLLDVFVPDVRMNYTLPYSILNQDGPWFRYINDLVLISPAVMVCAIGGAFLTARRDKAGLFLLLFLIFSYVVMGNLRYAINLRFANMWDFPLRWLALTPILLWADSIKSPYRGRLFYFASLGVLCFLELSNYVDIFVHNQVYDPVSLNLMRALNMIK